MKTLIIFLFYNAMLFALCPLPLTKDCKCENIILQGRVRITTFGEDFRVRITDIDPDIRVHITTTPIRCGEWDTVSASEDFRIKFVDNAEDFSIQFSDFPGLSTRVLNQ